ncbi:myb/SANT-like DNA-binding domain-containing protein 4 [Physella acuta]|uniref:myb/SANT-like DNA-binding domain-containing protein 4 n=1 Tax=Physella acuta TaxID=109671 RepID=UPI0027DAEC92|nr:myb/SANT-like DNA-binding domain-containing protein 4 [Physella acuta]
MKEKQFCRLAIEYLPATHDINDQILLKKINILLRDNKATVRFTTDEIQLVMKKLKEACVYQRKEKFQYLMQDLTLFCVNDNNISLICSYISLKCLRYAQTTLKDELLMLISKLMSNIEFMHKIAGDERLMGKNGFDKSLKKEIKKKSREFFIHGKTNEEKMSKCQKSSSGDGSRKVDSISIDLIKVDKTTRRKVNKEHAAQSGLSSASKSSTNSRRTVNWSIEEKSDLLVMVNEHRDKIESKKRDKTTRAWRQEAWENIATQFKSQHPTFTHLKTQGIIEQYQRLKSQVKKQLTQQNVSTVSGETGIDKSIVKLMCDICHEEFKEVMPAYQHNEEMTSVEHDDGNTDIAENENNEEDYIDVTEHQENAEVNELEIAADDDMEVTEHEHYRTEQHIYREDNPDTHFSAIDSNYISELPPLTPYYSTSPVHSLSHQMPEQTTSLYHGQENVQTYSSSVLENNLQEEITTHPNSHDFQVDIIAEQTDYSSHRLPTARQQKNRQTVVSRPNLKRKIMPYIRSQASKRKLEQEEIKLKREKQQEELKLAREKQAEEIRMAREKHEMEMEMLRLKKQCLERQLQQAGNTSGIFTSSQNVLDGDGASYLSLQ